MEAFHLHFAALSLILLGLVLYRAVLKGPSAAEAYGVWLAALLLSVPGMGVIWGAGRIFLGPDRSRTLLWAAAYFLDRHPGGGQPSTADCAYLFTLCASVLFVLLLPVLGRAAQRRSDGAIAEAIQQWKQERKDDRH